MASSEVLIGFYWRKPPGPRVYKAGALTCRRKSVRSSRHLCQKCAPMQTCGGCHKSFGRFLSHTHVCTRLTDGIELVSHLSSAGHFAKGRCDVIEA